MSLITSFGNYIVESQQGIGMGPNLKKIMDIIHKMPNGGTFEWYDYILKFGDPFWYDFGIGKPTDPKTIKSSNGRVKFLLIVKDIDGADCPWMNGSFLDVYFKGGDVGYVITLNTPTTTVKYQASLLEKNLDKKLNDLFKKYNLVGDLGNSGVEKKPNVDF